LLRPRNIPQIEKLLEQQNSKTLTSEDDRLLDILRVFEPKTSFCTMTTSRMVIELGMGKSSKKKPKTKKERAEKRRKRKEKRSKK